MSNDTNFNKHSQRFKKNIYDTDKGRLRLQLIRDDLGLCLTENSLNTPMCVLDAGCGLGQISLDLASKGHDLHLCDISDELLTKTQTSFNSAGLTATFYHSALQDLGSEHDQRYDLIIFHAVLEWLEDPQAIITQLKKRLKPGGYISLMFYNENSIILYNLLKGNFRKVIGQNFKGHPGGLTPTNPIKSADLNRWLKTERIEVLSQCGIRVFYDYLSKDLKENRSYSDILEMEKIYCRLEPFNQMARYIHYFCSLNSDV